MILCKYLLAYRGMHAAGELVKAHSHPFWQMDICLDGEMVLKIEETEMELGSGQLVLIPPQVNHELRYLRPENAFAVLKFSVDGVHRDEAQIVKEQPVMEPIRDALLRLLPIDGEPSPAACGVLEPLLAALVCAQFGGEGEQDTRPASLNARIRDYVQKQGGRYVTLSDLSRELGYSASHVSAEFRRSENMSLKSFLDAERAQAAMRLIQYSDYSIPTIAERLEFPDLHAFSRFVKRLTGKGPRAHRL